MSIPRILACAILAATPFVSANEIVFGPVLAQPGQKIRLVSRTEGVGGSIKREQDGKVLQGGFDLIRNRELTWTFRAPAADGTRRGMARIVFMNTDTNATLDGKSEKTSEASPLNGKIVAFSKPPGGEWKFELDGSLQTLRIEGEIAELTQYLKRKWYPEHAVKIGDSWEFDPLWVKMILQKDLQNAQTIGTMQLRQIRHTAQGRSALVSMNIESSGGDFQADGTETTASIDLKGEVLVNLQTMLEEQLTLQGTLRSRKGTVGAFTTTELPIRIHVTKSFVRE